MAVIVYQLIVLRRKLRERVFGWKLTVRLVVVFTLMALIPVGLVYAISFQFLQRSIESWFDVRIEESLNRGVSLGQRVLQNSLKELLQKADTMAQELATSQASDAATLNRLREQFSIEDATLMTTRGRIIAHRRSGKLQPRTIPRDAPNPAPDRARSHPLPINRTRSRSRSAAPDDQATRVATLRTLRQRVARAPRRPSRRPRRPHRDAEPSRFEHTGG